MTEQRKNPLPGTPADLPRQYVATPQGLVHYRVAGPVTGAARTLVMLHDSPRSSRLHRDAMVALSAAHPTWRIVALDTAGYGNSDSLTLDQPEIADFAAALGAALTTLGLSRAPLYATHTSAKIALAHVDAAAPDARPCRLVLDGLSMPETLASAEFVAAYMRPFVVDDAGAYLAAEWGRTRDMLRWFPWFSRNAQTRIPMQAPDAAWIEDYGIDLFAAGPSYSGAYAAAMRYDPAPALGRVAVPTLVAAKADDVLIGYLPRAAAVGSAQVTTQSLSADRGEWLAWLGAIMAETVCDPVTLPTAPSDGARAYVGNGAGGQIHLFRHGPATGTPALVIEAPTTLNARAWASALAQTMPVIVPELPGLGDSDPLSAPSLEAYADALANMLRALGVGAVPVLGIGLGAGIAAALAARAPDLVASLLIDGAAPLDTDAAAAMAAGLAPPIAYDAQAGGHLHRIWHMLRDSQAQWPWFAHDLSAMRRLPPVLDGAALHDALNAVLRQRLHWADAALAALAVPDPAGLWRAVPCPLRVLAHADPAHADAAAVAALAPQGTTLPRPDALSEAAALALRCFADPQAIPALATQGAA
ncbi:alpha/beta fold hydrolase [Novosphingobium sp. FSY-8]|uniref:Alpha/beta fold hydrolase n=1 Tax=Novosphingobium ovatum TaxID=1908523 RepID=A0ABW9XBX8_9SPHN|nr:alpha/beta hydrolase [Novosphingobium ovatum]NBC36028.1 alpha/beta fold hydrolase [Novosphingobium ovatum]